MDRLDWDRVDAALRDLIGDLDYDLHKSIEHGEEDGLDHYGELVAAFIAAY